MGSERRPEQGTLDLFGERSARAPATSAPEGLPAGGRPAAAPQQAPIPPQQPRAATQQAASAAMQQAPAAVQQRPAALPQPPAATQQPAVDAGPRTYQVAEIVRLAGRVLESRFGDVWVEGEISNLKTPGHCYFTLKDAGGQLPAVMFRSAAQRLQFRLADGLKVRARGRLSVYDVQGKLQLYVEALEPAGLGALQLAFEQLKRRLAAEGLFDA